MNNYFIIVDFALLYTLLI